MAQTRDQMMAARSAKMAKEQMSKQALDAKRKELENAEPVLVDGVDIRWCAVCSSGKVLENLKCSAYSQAGQVNWMRKGWCPLGNTGPVKPLTLEEKEQGKQRAGQQKQSRRR